MKNSNLQSGITLPNTVNKTIVFANGNSLNSSISITLNSSITTTSNLSVNQNICPENIASINPFRFSSEYLDSTIGLVYYNYRHYNPNDGRWLSRDPIAEKGGYNLYGMVGNNSLSRTDVLGRTAIAIGAGVGTVICPGVGTGVGTVVGIVITAGAIAIYYIKCKTEDKKTTITVDPNRPEFTCCSVCRIHHLRCSTGRQRCYQMCYKTYGIDCKTYEKLGYY